MSSETGTLTESSVWTGFTALLTWVFFGAVAMTGIYASAFLSNLFFLLTLAVVAVVQLVIDVLDQSRELNLIVLMFLFGVIGLVFYILGYVTVIVPVLGIFFYPLAAFIAERIVSRLPI